MTGVFDPSRADVRLTVESLTESRDGIGGIVKTWTKYKEIRAERIRRAGGETISTNQQAQEFQREYRIRFDDTITATMRCYEGPLSSTVQRFYVRDAQHYKRDRYSHLICERRDNA